MNFRLSGFPLIVLWCAFLTSCANSDGGSEDAIRAQSLLEQGRIAEAREAIEEALDQRGDEPQYHLLRGRIEFASGSTSRAYEAYKDAMAMEPTNMEALQAVSQLGLRTGNLRDSQEAAEVILTLEPNDTQALLTRGLHALIRSQFDEADDYANRALAVDPTSEAGAILKARIAFRKGDPETATEALDRATASRGETIGIALTRLEIYRALENEAGMRKQFAALRELAPEDQELRLDEANFAFKDGRAEAGIELTATLLAETRSPRNLISESVRLWYEYGVEKVSASLLAVIATSGSTQARIAVAAFQIDHGQVNEAIRMVDGLTGSDAESTRARILLLQDREVQAVRLAESVLRNDETNCAALAVRGRSALGANAKAALRFAQRAASQCPDEIVGWQMAAQAYSRLGDRENAERVWNQGMQANPQSSRLAQSFVDWLQHEGEQRKALLVARRLTRNAPALLSGWQLYRELCPGNDVACQKQARAGFAAAGTSYGIDLPPGEGHSFSLFGRLEKQ